MATKEQIINRIIKNASLDKYISEDGLEALYDTFNIDVTQTKYKKRTVDSLEMVLQFYKEYNLDYYNMIKEGLDNKIIINNDIKDSHADRITKKAYIGYQNTDFDLIILAHEFGHYIDNNSNPVIVPPFWHCFSEVPAFYMERQFEKWLDKEEYKALFIKRSINRLYFAKTILNFIKKEIYYEKLYKKQNSLTESDFTEEDFKILNKYNFDNSCIVNYVLRYPLANIYSTYLLSKDNINASNLLETCKNADFYEVLEFFKNNNKEYALIKKHK